MKKPKYKNLKVLFSTERFFYNINAAFDSVFTNRFRSLLTALGIIFGVAAVIAMLAIGSGARQEILDQMKMVGVNNIIIRPLMLNDPKVEDEIRGRFTPGLTMSDAESISAVLPTINRISPEIEISTHASRDFIRRPVRLAGVTPGYFEVFNLDIIHGAMFTEEHLKKGSPACIIGSNIRLIYFGNSDPIGQQIKCGNNWLTIVGVVEERHIAEESIADLGVAQFANTIYTPVRTVLLRYTDRSFVSAVDIQRQRANQRAGRSQNNNDEEEKTVNHHQLDRIVVQVEESGQLIPTANIIERMLKRKHNDVKDFEVIIPEILLRQEQRTRDIFNVVLGAIAGISLLVGGIGIMNIMLANVMERTREIGVRLAVGAKKTDIIFQFLAESTFISLTGGIIGVFLGIFLSGLIMRITGILTIVSLQAILISFGVAAIVGIAFGFMPAKKAAEKDPVTSLRYE